MKARKLFKKRYKGKLKFVKKKEKTLENAGIYIYTYIQVARSVQRCLFRFTSIFAESHGSQSR